MNDLSQPTSETTTGRDEQAARLRAEPGEQPTDRDRATVRAFRRYVAELLAKESK